MIFRTTVPLTNHERRAKWASRYYNRTAAQLEPTMPILQFPPRHQHANVRHLHPASAPVGSTHEQTVAAANRVRTDCIELGLGATVAGQLRGLCLQYIDSGTAPLVAYRRAMERAQQLAGPRNPQPPRAV